MTSMSDVCVDNLVEKRRLLGTKRSNHLLVTSGLQNCVPIIQWRQGDRREWGAADQREYAICWVCWAWMNNCLKSLSLNRLNPMMLDMFGMSHPKFCSYPVLTHRKQTCCSNLPVQNQVSTSSKWGASIACFQTKSPPPALWFQQFGYYLLYIFTYE